MSTINVKKITHGNYGKNVKQNIDLMSAAEDFMENILGSDARGAKNMKLKTANQNIASPGSISKAKNTYAGGRESDPSGGGGGGTG